MLTLQVAHALELEWSDLALNAIEKNIFSFPWFVIPSLPLLVKKNPEIVTIYQGNLLIGFLVIQKDFGYAKLPISFYRTALHPHQFLGTPLIREGYEDQFVAGICAWLDAAPRKRCFLLLTHLTGDSKMTNAIETTCKAQNRQLIELDRFQRAAIISGLQDKEVSENQLSASRRKSLHRKLKNLTAQGGVTIERLSSEDEIGSWLEDFLNIENTGWKREKETSILSSAANIAFYRKMTASAFKNGSLNFFRLSVAGKPISYTLDITCAPYAYCLKSAFDPSYKKYSPGVLMEYETLKYYSQHKLISIVDSCTDPKNKMLNELWPNRKPIVTLALARRGAAYKLQFAISHMLKNIKKIGSGSAAHASKD